METRKPPLRVTFLATCFLLLGILGVPGGCIGFLGQPSPSMHFTFSRSVSIEQYYVEHVPNYVVYLAVSGMSISAASVVLIVAGSGLSHLRSWARYLALGYAGYAVMAGVLRFGYYVYYIWPMDVRFLEDVRNSVFVPRDPWDLAHFGLTFAAVRCAVSLLFAACIVNTLRRPSIAKAFCDSTDPRRAGHTRQSASTYPLAVKENALVKGG